MEKKQCGACQLEVNEIEPLRCGFCDVYFHIGQQCCGFNLSRPSRDLFSQGKAMFVCQICRDELNGRSVKSYIADIRAPVTSSSPGLQTQVQQLSKLVETLNEKVDCYITKNVNADRPPVRLQDVGGWPRLGLKRRRGNDNLPITTTADRGTSNIDLSDLSVDRLTPVILPPKFWLYLSGFHPQVTEDDVQKIASRCLQLTTPADVVRLVPKGAEVARLIFVSFKVGLDPSLKDLALNASTWPSGILFREFIDQSKNRVTTSNTGQPNADLTNV